MSTLTAHVLDSTGNTEHTGEGERIGSRECAALAQVPLGTWDKLWHSGRAPQPLAGQNGGVPPSVQGRFPRRLEWDEAEVVAWANKRKDTPTLALREAEGILVCKENSKHCAVINKWKREGQLADEFCPIMDVKVQDKRPDGTFIKIKPRQLYVVAELDRIAEENAQSRAKKVSDARKKACEDHIELDSAGRPLETWRLKQYVADYLGVTADIIDAWSDPKGNGCPLLKNRVPLTTTTNFPPEKRWAMSVAEKAKKNLIDDPNLLREGIWPDGIYSPKKTRIETGLGSKVVSSPAKSKAHGLERVLCPVYVRSRRGHLQLVHKAGFTSKSVDECKKKKRSIPSEKMRIEDFAKKVGISRSTAHHWFRDHLIDGEFADYEMPNKGQGVTETNGVLISKSSIGKVKRALSRAKGVVQIARFLLENWDNPDRVKKLLPKRGELTVREAVDELANENRGPSMGTIIDFCESGLLEAAKRERLANTGLPTYGWLIQKKSVTLLKKTLASVGSIVEARKVLIAERDKRKLKDRKHGQSAAPRTPADRPGLRPTWEARKQAVLSIINELGTDSAGFHMSFKTIVAALEKKDAGQRRQTTRQILQELKTDGKYRRPI